MPILYNNSEFPKENRQKSLFNYENIKYYFAIIYITK